MRNIDVSILDIENSERKLPFEQIYLIKCGVRDCALIDIPTNIYSKFENDLNEYMNQFMIKSYIHYWNNYISFFLYKRDFQLELFKECFLTYFENDTLLERSLKDQYILGKLLGYSEESMEEYFSKL